ncbi:MAG: thiamine-phosphate kinase, partial [Candidatus Dormibacteria bacterium]
AWRVAASDLAAMGARPEAGLAAALLPPGTSARAVAAIQLGLVEAAAEDGASLVGGDLSATAGPLALTVSAWAQLWNRAPVRLGGGRAGEALIVTGALGGAAGALDMLQSGLEPPSQLRARLCDPPSRGAAGEALARAGASAMTDLSDGLVLDLGRLCASSGQGAELWLDHLPLEAELADRLPDRARELALSGGEDFELLASLPRDRLGELRRAWSSELPALSEIGELSADPGVRLWSRPGGEQVPAPGRSGFRHF